MPAIKARRTKHIAEQYELPIIEQRARDGWRPELPARRTLIRIAGSDTDCNGVWRVASAIALPGGGMFLGLEQPIIPKRNSPAVSPAAQELLNF